MDNDGICDEKLMKKELIAGLKLLNNCKVDVIVMACNTVHIYYKYLQKKSKAQILNIVSFAIPSEKYGVIGSRTTREYNLYGGIQVNNSQQKVINEIIGRILTGKTEKNDSKKINKIINSLFKKGARKVILGCTELPILVKRRKNIIDPLEEILIFL